MRTYVATFYNNNYGSALQAYALQTKLKDLGADPVIIAPEPKKTGDSLTEKIRFYFRKEKHYGPFRKIRRSVQKRLYRAGKKKINDFIKEKTEIIEYRDAHERMNRERCLLIAGSDQIWNTLNHPIDELYLFSQVDDKNSRKASYAASIGLSEITEEQKQYYRNALSSFESISFRENQAFELLKDEFPDTEVRCDVDPTLLFDGTFWEELIPEKKETDPYLFIYMLRPDRNVIKIARKLAKEKGLKMVYMGLYTNRYPGVKTVSDAGIEDFLGYIHDAKIVITNSFHGTVFSLLFHRKFASVHIDSTSSRVDNLLQMTGLEDHKIKTIEESSVANKEYDYAEADRKIAEKRKESIDYLKRIIAGR